LRVVAGQDGATVVLADLGTETRERGFLPEKLIRVSAP